MRKLSWFFLLLIIGCSPEVPQSESVIVDIVEKDSLEVKSKDAELIAQPQRVSGGEDTSFLASYNELVIAVGTHNDSLFNHYINKTHGLYVVESRGALPSMFKIMDIKGIKISFKNKTINELLYHEMEAPIFEELPKVICDTTIYDKQGCFASEENPLQKSRPWNYASLNEKEIQAIEFLAETVSMTVVNTSNFTFYFSKIEGNWYLTFSDLRTPCQA